MAAGVLLILALGLALWRKIVSWRGLPVALVTILVTAVISVLGVTLLQPHLAGIFGWETSAWPDWPEVIPPYGGLAPAVLDLLVLGLCSAGYILARRWSGRADFSLIGLLPFAILAMVLAAAEPRTAYAFIWPVITGSMGWIASMPWPKYMDRSSTCCCAGGAAAGRPAPDFPSRRRRRRREPEPLPGSRPMLASFCPLSTAAGTSTVKNN
jgi:hypothetical protein